MLWVHRVQLVLRVRLVHRAFRVLRDLMHLPAHRFFATSPPDLPMVDRFLSLVPLQQHPLMVISG